MSEKPARRHLDTLLCARSIVIIGASADPTRLGGMPIQSLLDGGFPPEKILLVNPRYPQISGLPCHASVRELPWVPELAVLAISRDSALPVLRDCHAVGIGAAVLFASGFAEEHSSAGDRARQELIELARDTGMLISGPNCLGFANFHDRLFATFMKNMTVRSEPGSVAVLAQSGNMAGLLRSLGIDAGLRFSFVINTGNEDCLDFTDYLAHLAEDPRVDKVLGYVEQIRDGARFMQVAHRMRELGKPLFLLKAGTSLKGAEAAASHTAAMAGNAQAYTEAFRQLGIQTATDPIRLVDLARLALQGPPLGKRVCIVSVSGAGGALVADHLSRFDVDIPTLSDTTQARLRSLIPSYGMVSNPIDLTGQVTNDRESIAAVIDAIAGDSEIDAVVYYLTGPAVAAAAPHIVGLFGHNRQLTVIVDTAVAPSHAPLEAAGVPVFTDMNRATTAVAAWLQTQDSASARWTPQPPTACGIAAHSMLPRLQQGRLLTEVEVKTLLRDAGLPMVTEQVATTADQAAAMALQCGWPVAMKILSRDLPHKTEAGGVRLDIGNVDQARRAFDDIVSAVRHASPHALVDGVVVQPMIGNAQPMLVGLVRDSVFGWMMTVGLGGVMAELHADVAHRLLPLCLDEALGMLRELRSLPLLTGYRGSAPADVAALAAFMVDLAEFVMRHGSNLDELEINPVLVRPAGKGVIAVDALARLAC